MHANKHKLCTGSTVDFCSCKIDISAIHGGCMQRAGARMRRSGMVQVVLKIKSMKSANARK